MARRVTSKDVADRAGVSRSAVSLVLNGRGDKNISPAKQAAIRAAAEELGYRPDPVALSLRGGGVSTIGLVVDAMDTPASAALIGGAASGARALGHGLLLAESNGTEVGGVGAHEALVARGAAGLVHAAVDRATYDPPPVVRGTPTVLAQCVDEAGALSAVLLDEAEVVAEATRHLLDCGHRRIALVITERVAPEDLLWTEGFRRATAARGLAAADPLTTTADVRGGYELASKLLADPLAPTAVLVRDDRTALGVLLAATALGRSVPGGLSLITTDGELAAGCAPTLTAIRLPLREVAERAVRRLLDELAGRARPGETIQVSGELITRGSVAPPPS